MIWSIVKWMGSSRHMVELQDDKKKKKNAVSIVIYMLKSHEV